MLLMWILISFAAIAFIYWKIIKPHRYWLEQGMVQVKVKDFLSDNFLLLVRKHTLLQTALQGYRRFPNARYIGTYSFGSPVLLIRDPELIKQLTVKDFDHFLDHRSLMNEDVEPLWAKNLFALKGQRWKDMRATISPTFTSSKMRIMFGLVSECAEQFADYFSKQNFKIIDIEMKDAFTRFTNDVIATTAFGIKCDSLVERDNEFFLMGKEITDFSSASKTTRFFALFILPEIITKYFKISIFGAKVLKFFRSLISEAISVREEEGIVRPDMIHLLLEARKEHDKYDELSDVKDAGFATVEESHIGKERKHISVTNEDIMAQALVFFFAGFDSVSTLMCFTAYELALNPEIQERLRLEVDNTVSKCAGKLTYEAILEMNYLDMVVSETLRKWPVFVAIDRVCTKPYTIYPIHPDETSVHLKEGDFIWLPVAGLHYDPQYYANPDKFDPERFSHENKRNIQPFTYLPFGTGPRNCIGSRFALLETKAILFYLLSKFQFTVTERTEIPVQLSKASFNLSAANGIWLGLKARNE